MTASPETVPDAARCAFFSRRCAADLNPESPSVAHARLEMLETAHELGLALLGLIQEVVADASLFVFNIRGMTSGSDHVLLCVAHDVLVEGHARVDRRLCGQNPLIRSI